MANETEYKLLKWEDLPKQKANCVTCFKGGNGVDCVRPFQDAEFNSSICRSCFGELVAGKWKP